MKHARASTRSSARTAALAAVATLLVGLPVLATARLAGAGAPVSDSGDLQAPVRPRPRQTAPGFQAPVATVCSDAPRMRDVPDPQPSAQDIAAPDTRTRRAAGGPPMAPPPMPSPAALAAKAVVPSRVVHLDHAAPVAPVPPPQRAQGPVTAGVVDDNADFAGFRQFLQRHPEAAGLGRDLSVRQRLRVVDAQGRPVPDAEVTVSAANGARLWARTDAGGQAWLHLNAFDDQDSAQYRVVVRRDGRQAQAQLRRGQKAALEMRLPVAPPAGAARLDLVFLVDATGSMGDEIDKLRASLQDIVRGIGQLPARPDVCLGLVAYRDRGDDFFVRSWDLTGNTAAFQQVLDGVRAGGGGDMPEAMNEAFAHAVQALAWRGPATTRLLVSLADAPPHMDYPRPHYDQTMLAALGKGIKVFSVAASGQDTTGEIVQRQIAQYTGGRFIFLTYKDAADPGSGPGRETVHDVANYSVDTLDELVVRLVREELAQLPQG